MDFEKILTAEEKITFALRALYSEYGYELYKMSKFEEYGLYAQNKDFLVSENVITFTDTDGRLLALKPDVTLSIIKNGRDFVREPKKLFYNENVYRVSKGTRSFKEIMQVGLERLGEVDESAIAETLALAEKSLATISPHYALEISHLDIPLGVLNAFGVSDGGKREFFAYLGEKNVQGVRLVAKAEGLTAERTELLEELARVYGAPSDVADALEKFATVGEQARVAVTELKAVLDLLRKSGAGEKICVDFSVVNDGKYYNGVAFQGFVEGVPTSVLSGGQYDKLMKKMKKSGRAIGFAVYLDGLERAKGADV